MRTPVTPWGFLLLGALSLAGSWWLLGAGPPAQAAPGTDAAVCVYGGTSAGVVAAVQAARMGKSVVLIAPDGHIGGMTTGGLGATDRGSPRTVSGLAREFYRGLYDYY